MVQAYNYRGRAHFEDGDYWKCVDDNSKALQIDGEFKSGYADRGRAYETLGLAQEAEEDFKQYTVRHREKKFKENQNPLSTENAKV